MNTSSEYGHVLIPTNLLTVDDYRNKTITSIIKFYGKQINKNKINETISNNHVPESPALNRKSHRFDVNNLEYPEPYYGSSGTSANQAKSIEALSLLFEANSTPRSPTSIPESPPRDCNSNGANIQDLNKANGTSFISPASENSGAVSIALPSFEINHKQKSLNGKIQKEILNGELGLKKHSISSTAILIPQSKQSTEITREQVIIEQELKIQNLMMIIGDLVPAVKNLNIKVENYNTKVKNLATMTGNLANDVGCLTENTIRLQINNIDNFGPQFSSGVEITSLHLATEHVLKASGINWTDIKAECVKVCVKIRDMLKPNENYSEFVTGIQKEILLWYLARTKTYKQKSSPKLEDKLIQYPWLDNDGKLSLKNVRKCIQWFHKDLRTTLAFFAQPIDWNDVASFSARKDNTSGKVYGHGWYLFVHHCLASYCKAINASQAEEDILMPFPPSGELEIDVCGRIDIGKETVQIEIGEIKTSTKGIQKAKTQLKRASLICSLLCHCILEEANIPHIVKGYIFVAGKKEKKDPIIIPEEKLFMPPGKINYSVIETSKYSPPRKQID